MQTDPTIDGQEPQKKVDLKPEGQEPTDPKVKKDDSPGEIDFSDPKQAREAIDALRKENAKHRITNKELDSKFSGLNDRYSKLEKGLKGLFGEGDDDLPPEEKIEKLSQANQDLQSKTALLELAYENGIPKDAVKYFSFLVSEAVMGLEDDQELSDEALADIVKDVKSKTAPQSTSVTPKGNGGNPPAANTGAGEDDVSLDQFLAMNMGEKSVLFKDNKALYEKLFLAAKTGKKL